MLNNMISSKQQQPYSINNNNYNITPRSHNTSRATLQRIPRLKINDADILEETDISNYTTSLNYSPLNYTYNTNLPLAQPRQRRNSSNSVLSQFNGSPATSRRSSFSRNFLSPLECSNFNNSNSCNLTNSNKTLLNSLDEYYSSSSCNDSNHIIEQYLRNAGFLPSQTLHQGNNGECTIKLALTSNDILIPTISSNEDEYLARLNRAQTPVQSDSQLDLSSLSISDMESVNRQSSQTSHTDNNSLCYFKFAVIVSLNNTTSLESIQLELSSRANIKYLNNNNNSNSQSIKIGELNWNLNKYNFNLFLPKDMKSLKHDAVENTNILQWKLFKNTNHKKRTTWQDDKESVWKDSLFQKFKNNNGNSSNLSPGDYVFIVPVLFNNHIPETHSFPSGNLDYFIRLATLQKNIDTTVSPQDVNIPMALPDITTTTTTTGSISSDNSFISDFNPSSSYSRYSVSTRDSVDITDWKFNNCAPLLPPPKNSNSGNIPYVVNELYLQNKLSVIRTPPLISVSTANRPIYIDKVWNDSLAYEIILPNKYIPTDSTIPITIKLSPLIKNISLKKIAIGISERINYSNPIDKKLSFKETDIIAKDRSNPYYHIFNSKKKKERLLLLYELRSEEPGPRALREEIVSNCINNNLLSYYRAKQSNNTNIGGDNFIEPIEIKTKLKIPNEKGDSSVPLTNNQSIKKKKKGSENPYGIDGYTLIDEFNNLDSFYPSTTPHKSTPIVEPPPAKEKTYRKNSFVNFFFGGGSATTSNYNNIHNKSINANKRNSSVSSNKSVNKSQQTNHFKTKINLSNKKNVAMIDTKIYNAKRGLYIDSTHFSTLKCKHKLEIIMKLEKYDSNNVLRQYEVVVNTPIYLMSDKCTNDTLELPMYDIDGDTYYQPTQDGDTSLPPPPTFKESLSNPLFPNSNINTDSTSNITNNNSIDSNHYTYQKISQNISSQLNTEFSNLDGLLNSDIMSPTYRRINNINNNVTNAFPPMGKTFSSPPPAYLDVVPSQS